MYNNPLDNKEFSFYLNFKNDDTGLLEISEPVKFDASTFVIEQDKKRYGRDVFFMNEEISLEFYSDYFTPSSTNVILPNGEVVNHLSHGFEFLNKYYRDFGFESEVEFILKRNDLTFITGVLDFATCDTDELTYYKFKVIQNTRQAQIKRREDVQVDLFSNKDLDDNDITPLSTTNILLKAKPVLQLSKWGEKNLGLIQQTGSAFNCQISIPVANLLTKFKIEDSYAPFDNFFKGLDVSFAENNNYRYANRLLTAKTTLTDVNIKINKLSVQGFTNLGTFGLNISRAIFDSNGNWISNVGSTINLYQSIGSIGLVDEYFETTIPIMNVGESLIISMECFYSSSGLLSFNMFFNSYSLESLEISLTSTAIDSVIKGFRHIDLIKQTVKSINGMSVNAPKYDVGGNFYNNFVFNGKLIRQFDKEPFYSKFKDAVGQLQELNSDYQINENEIYIGQYSDFYSNNEIASFLQKPDSEFKSSFNNRYSINQMEYKYKSFEQDRDEDGTIDAVHTNTQWLLPNKQVENNLKIEVDYVRDPFEIESARRQGIYTKDSTSLSNDDKIYIIDVIELAPNSRNEFNSFLRYRFSIEDNTLKLISDGTFNWSLLGFNIANEVFVTIGSSGLPIEYNVTELESNVITLTPVIGSISINQTGENSIIFNYPLTNVGYVNRTNEEFQVIENVESPENYSNLQYTIKRNLKYFESYLACASKYNQSGIIKNTYFKSNGELITEFRNGGQIKENDSFIVADLETRLLEPILIETKVIAEYDTMIDVLQKMQNINVDNSIGGFIRVMDTNNKVISLFPTDLSYNWGTKQLSITGEQKFLSDVIEITTENDLIIINKVGYDTKIVKPLEVKTNGDYVQLFDFRGIALFNEIKFNKVLINSNNFSNIVELTDALINL